MWFSIFSITLFIVVLFSLSMRYCRTTSSPTNNSNSKNIQYFFIIFAFSFFFGIRYDFGNDYEQYLEWYESDKYSFDDRTEILFRVLSITCLRLDIPGYVYFGILAFIEIFFFLLMFKNDKKVIPYIFIFLLTSTYTGYGINFWMNGIRQAIAMCIWAGAIPFIDKKRFVPYILFCILAVGFHTSALILIPVYYLSRLKKDYLTNVRYQLLFFYLVFVAKVFFESIMTSLDSYLVLFQKMTGGAIYGEYEMSGMLEDMEGKSGGGVFVMIQAVVHSIIIINSNKMKAYFHSNRFVIFYYLYYFGLLTTFVFPEGIVSLSRPFRYFGLFQIVMLAFFSYYLSNSPSKKKNGKYYSLVLQTLYYMMFVVSQMVASADSHLWYKTIFNS